MSLVSVSFVHVHAVSLVVHCTCIWLINYLLYLLFYRIPCLHMYVQIIILFMAHSKLGKLAVICLLRETN